MKKKKRKSVYRCKVCLREFKSVSRAHLFYKHDFDEDHPLEQYKRMFRLKYAASESTRRKQSRSQIRRQVGLGQHWTKTRVKKAISEEHAKGLPINIKAVRKRQPTLLNHGLRLFGSWGKAITAAGINYDRVRSNRAWTKRRIVAWLRKARKDGSPLNSAELYTRDGSLYATALRLFGSWNAALEAAGIAPRTVRKHGRYPQEYLKEWVSERVRRGKSIEKSVVLKEHPRLVYAVQNNLKCGWSNFVTRLGYHHSPIQGPKKWDRALVLKTIKERYRKGQSLRHVDIPKALYCAAYKYAGTWGGALEAAKVPKRDRPAGLPRWTDKKIRRALRTLRPGSKKLTWALVRSISETGLARALQRRGWTIDKLRRSVRTA